MVPLAVAGLDGARNGRRDEARALHLVTSTQINGTDNPMARKGITVVVAPELMSQTGYTDGDESWYAVCSVGNAMAKAPMCTLS